MKIINFELLYTELNPLLKLFRLLNQPNLPMFVKILSKPDNLL